MGMCLLVLELGLTWSRPHGIVLYIILAKCTCLESCVKHNTTIHCSTTVESIVVRPAFIISYSMGVFVGRILRNQVGQTLTA